MFYCHTRVRAKRAKKKAAEDQANKAAPAPAAAKKGKAAAGGSQKKEGVSGPTTVNDTPIEWVRVDADMLWIRHLELYQTETMTIEQLRVCSTMRTILVTTQFT